MNAFLHRPARPFRYVLVGLLSQISISGTDAQAVRRPETKARPMPAVTERPVKQASRPILPPVRMPERPSFWDEPVDEPNENEELVGELLMIPFQLLFTAGAQSIIAGYDAWKDVRDPGRHVDDRYLQAAIRLKDAKNPRLRQRSIASLTNIPDPSAAKADLKKALRYDPSANVRKSAAVALGKIDDPDCLDYLSKAMLYDSSADVRQICSMLVARARAKSDTAVSRTSQPATDDSNRTSPKPGEIRR